MKLNRDKIIKETVRLLLELLVVFVGVYLAFLLTDYRAEREKTQRQQQLHQALAQEINVFIAGADHIAPRIDTLYATWRRHYEADEKPEPFYLQLGGVDLPPRGMWEAVVASDGLATLDVSTMQKISEFYNALDIMIDRYRALNEFAEHEIIPYEGRGHTVFYDASSDKLKPPYAAYMQRLRGTLELFEIVRTLAARSKEILEDKAHQKAPAKVDA